MSFKEFLLQLEMNTIGVHNDGNSGNWGNSTGGGGVLDTQQTGSETKSLSGFGGDNQGTSLHSTELGLPMRQDKNVPVIAIDYPNLSIQFGSGFGSVRFKERSQWDKMVRGNLPLEVQRGHGPTPVRMVADVEWYAHADDKTPGQKHFTAIWLR